MILSAVLGNYSALVVVSELQDRGVAVKMLTSDGLPVASEIARGVGLSNIKRMADLKVAIAHVGSTEETDLVCRRRWIRGSVPGR